ncbi:restriction endonuclease subunit S [Pseudarthrobacter phenanthrenivorans]|uniref:restriction endonuclease subunit S n=1 Tax=Pseudarthrobacter phenanthrenivorans TaxID=361575 RepID=UPI0011260E3B|nr:restriction endonuclease subunit S [Pseudarthrobacter phenanthrenivorans]TPV49680.1 restriction endonuclease subunit S [Pseudarthrobacter phenanthrenivorans]
MSSNLGDHCSIIMGQAPPGDTYSAVEGTPLIAGAGDFSEGQLRPKKFTSKPTKLSRAGDIVLSIRASIGDKVWADRQYCLGRGVAALRPGPELDASFLWHWLNHAEPSLQAKAKGATFLQVNRSDIAGLRIALPPLDEQRRIAAILDKADDLRTKRRGALAHLDALTQSIFHSMFGDPAKPGSDVRLEPIEWMASRFSDGPFGSNLKSAHYVDEGVRVVRLQNIGDGKFINRDSAFISADHFKTLSRHECLPGDVLIGTLGEPNLRACVQPNWLPRALNKADCLQLRLDPKRGSPEYVAALLNNQSTRRIASGLILGQTRGRISLGRLRSMVVPIPRLELQQMFANRVAAVERLKETHRMHLAELDALFASLQHRAFNGEL